MNPVNAAQVKTFAESSLLKDRSDSDLFELYSIYSVLAGHLGEGVEPIDVHLKGTEFGLDGVAILVQGALVASRSEVEDILEEIKNPSIEFIFFQAKNSPAFDYGEISKFFDGVLGFFSGGMDGESAQLTDLIQAKDAIYANTLARRNPGLRAYFCSVGNYARPQRIEKLVANTRTKLEALSIFDNAGIDLQMVGAEQLQRYYRAASSSVEVRFNFPRNVVMPPNDNVEEAYIGYLNADQILKMVTIYGEDGSVVDINKSVFFDNIRDFDEGSKINLEIMRTLDQDEGSDFVFRNNGITVVAKSITRTGDDFRIEDYQIVNGCQTSNIIFRKREEAEKIYVPFRLIGSKSDDFIASIIVGTNRQNPVKDEQFWALRPFMKNFEEYCRSLDGDERIFFERRENQYRGQTVERARIIQPPVLMKAVSAMLLYQPNRSARDYRKISAEYKEEIFLDAHDVRLYYVAAYLHYKLEFLWRNQRILPEWKIFRYYIMYALSRKAGGRGAILTKRKGEIEKYVSELTSVYHDEERLKKAIRTVCEALTTQVTALGLDSRERTRDTIRSDTFFSNFDRELQRLDTGVPQAPEAQI